MAHQALTQHARARLKKIVFILLLAGGHLVAFRNGALTAADLLRGDGSIGRVRPGPRYSLLRVPDSPAARRYDADNHLAADFAVVYFAARESAKDTAYSWEESPDPWGRPSRSAPLIHWACAVTICGLPYGPASVLHVALQYVVFVLSFAWAFRELGVRRHLAAALLFVHFGLFLTPVGLSWLERGQFSLYIAAAYIWLLLGVYRSNAAYLAVAGALAFMKWTSFPMLFVVLGVWVLASRERATFLRRVLLALVPLTVVVVLLLPFPEQALGFMRGLASQELGYSPEGLSLARVFPRTVVKVVPLILVVIGVIRARWSDEAQDWVPFVLASAITLLLYPTLAFDYSVPCLFGLIPFAWHWAQRRGAPDRLSAWLLPGGFCLFMAVASTVKILDRVAAADTDVAMVWMYLACASLLLTAPAGPARTLEA